MNSVDKIEQIISEIEEYLDGCKPQAFSGSKKIIVEKDIIDEMLVELRMSTPEEIKRYQKIIASKDAIIGDAQNRADEMLADARSQTEQMIEDHVCSILLACEAEEKILAEFASVYGYFLAVVASLFVMLIFSLTLFARCAAA